jgi:ribosomal protein S18 acetylase RimI-like enzyme
VLIRDRCAGDVGALEEIARETHLVDGYPKYLPGDLRSFIMSNDALGAWVAARDGEVLGHVAVHRSSAQEVMDVVVSATGLGEDGIAVVARLLVAPAARRQGIGRALLDKATRRAANLGRRAVLEVVEDHRAAIALYEKCGWTRAGRVDRVLPGNLPLRELVFVAPE